MANNILQFRRIVCLIVMFMGLLLVSSGSAVAAASDETINDSVTFEVLGSTYSATRNTDGCPDGFQGKFSFDARLKNASVGTLSSPKTSEVFLRAHLYPTIGS